jgi:pimeloyl-ACP methyl ester carboxylesterase
MLPCATAGAVGNPMRTCRSRDGGAGTDAREPGAVGERGDVDVTGGRLEVETSAGDPDLPTLVFLHEGLGSIDLWRGFPDEVAAATGGASTVVFSRHGHGHSAPARLPRPATYMHHEADVVLPELLRALGVERPVLVGHSDGASISLLYAGAGQEVTGLVCLAPHVFVEPESITGIEAARKQFDTSDMAVRMGRYHDDPTATFRGWNDVWLSDEFASWNIQGRLAGITAPALLIQGTDDQYGTMAQLDAIEEGVGGDVEQLRVTGAGHAPHLDAREEVVAAVAAFASRHWLG